MIDYYKLLEVPTTATYDEVITACKSLRQRLEAEITTGTNVDGIDILQTKLSLTIEAQLVLSDPTTRTEYNEQLASEPKSNIIDPFAARYFDFQALINDELLSWTELVNDWDGELSIDTFRQLLSKISHLPHSDIQVPIVLAALLLPSALAGRVPTMHLYGLPGCGKSTLGIFACKIWGSSPVAGSATFATIRRILGSQASADENGKNIRLHNVLVWEDLSPPHLADENKSNIAKLSGDPSTSLYKMPKKDTDNEFLEIQTHCMKWITSIHPFFSDTRFTEMKRRMLVIQCEKSSNPTVDMQDYNWDGLELLTRTYWIVDGATNAKRYIFLRRGIVAALRKSTLSTDRQTLCTDLLTAGMTWGVWESNKLAVQNLVDFYRLQDDLSLARESPLKSVLAILLKNKVAIPAQRVKEEVRGAINNGLIDRLLSGQLTAEMRLLGWELNVSAGTWERQA
jgi:hypothetical protein